MHNLCGLLVIVGLEMERTVAKNIQKKDRAILHIAVESS